MKLGEPSLDQLRIFLAVAEEGSFGAAARKMGRAVSAVSYGISQMEAQLGVTLFERATVPVVWAGNFSLGVTLFLRIVQQAAALVGQAGGYDAGIHEVHHRAKADSPSGTALHVAEAVRSGWPDAPADRAISSTRVGHVPGTHTVWFDGPEDTLELTHTARSRDGFATGALRAATWLGEQPPAPGLWRFDELVAHRLGEAPIPVSHRIDHHPTEEDA